MPLLNTIEISAIRYDNEPIVRSLSAVALLLPTVTSPEQAYIRWTFDDTLVWARNSRTGAIYGTDTIDTLAQLSSMVFYLSTDDTYDYKTEASPILFTIISAAWLSGYSLTDIDDTTIDEVTSLTAYKLEYDLFPNIEPPVLYINYENTEFSPLFYRAQAPSSTYNCNVSAVYSPSYLNLTNLLTESENFRSTVWTESVNLSVVPNTTIAPDNKLSATKLIPLSGDGRYFNTIKSVTNILSGDLPSTFLAIPSSYIIPKAKHTTTGSGIDAVFQIDVASNTISNISVLSGGYFYEPGDLIEIKQDILGLTFDDPSVSFEVKDIINYSHEISRTYNSLPAQTYTYSIMTYPSGGKFLYLNGFNQGPAIYDLESSIAYNYGNWKAVNIDVFEPEGVLEQVSFFEGKFNGPIKSVIRLNDPARYIIGGDFTTCNNVNVGYICAVDLSGGGPLTTGFAPSGFNARVNSLSLSSNSSGSFKMFVGGNFTQYRGQAASFLTCLTGNGGRASNSVFNGTTGSVGDPPRSGEVVVVKAHPTANRVFVGGDFDTYSNFNGEKDGQYRNGMVVLYQNGLEVPSTVFDIRGWDGVNYDSWNNNAGVGKGGTARCFEFEEAGSLLIGGTFKYSGTEGRYRGYGRTQHIVRTFFLDQPSKAGDKLDTLGQNRGFEGLGGPLDVDVNTIITNPATQRIFIGGRFAKYNAINTNGLVCIQRSGSNTINIPSGFSAGSIVNTLAFGGTNKNTIYVGGYFSSYSDGGARPTNCGSIIRLSSNTGSGGTLGTPIQRDSSFSTDLGGFTKLENNSTVTANINTLSISGNNNGFDEIFAGGDFRAYRGRSINYGIRLQNDGFTELKSAILPGTRNWLRCTATFVLSTQQSSKLTVGVTTNTETISTAATINDDLYVWGAQLNYGETGPATPYLSTGATPRTRIYATSFLYFNNPSFLNQTPILQIPLNTSLTNYSFLCAFNVNSLPMLSSIQVTVSANSTYDSYAPWRTPHTLTNSLSVIFVQNLLSADFVAYPGYYFLSSGQPFGRFGYSTEVPTAGNENYTLTPGPCFYGEGHTETIYLSARGSNATQYFWNVTDNAITYEVSAVGAPQDGRYKVNIPTQLDIYPSIPISLVVSDGTILSSGPLYYFDDTNGNLTPYPFYYDTEVLSSKNTKYRKNIEVVSYIPPSSSFDAGFIKCPDFLPTDDSIRRYSASLICGFSGEAGNTIDLCYGIFDLTWRWSTFKHLSGSNPTQPFGPTSVYTEISSTLFNKPSSWGTMASLSAPITTPPFGTVPGSPGPYPKIWNLETVTLSSIERSPNFSWGGPLTWLLSTENWTVETQVSAKGNENPAFNYYLQNLQTGSNPFTFSIYKNMPFYLEGSRTVYSSISAPPYDWDTKEYLIKGSGNCSFESRGDLRLYTSNRYVLTGTNVIYQNISLGFNNVDRIEIDLDDGQPLKILQGSSLYNNLTANYIIPGYKNITGTVYYNITSNGVPVSTFYKNLIKVIDSYDTIDVDNYRTEKTQLTLPWNSIPAIAPNEWINEDNINAVVKKFYDNLNYLYTRGRTYNSEPAEFYGWLGTPPPETISVCSKYTWEDLDCLNGGTSVKWEDVQEINSNFPSISTTGVLASCCSWNQHYCPPEIQNPDRLGKYCIDWKWRSRKSVISTLPTTWENTRSGFPYNKKWRFEPCTTKDGLVLVGSACDEGEWQVNINKLDTYYDPIANCTSISRCSYRDVVSRNNIIYVALSNEVKVLSSDYSASFITSKLLLDDIFAFRDIRGLALDSTNKLFVIDGTLNRVASYNINFEDPVPFELFISWGGYGTAKSSTRFSRPNDICIDLVDNVWVADTGNRCIKQYSNTGTWLQTIIDNELRSTPPISMTADSQNNIHVLCKDKIRVYKQTGEFSFEYTFIDIIKNQTPIKINSNYNKELIYVIFNNKILRFFRNGVFAGYLINEKTCANGLQDAYQDEFRNTLILSNDKILKYIDVMSLESIVGNLPNTYWALNDLLIHKDEYVQNWVYNKTFQRLWDNIEILRHSLMYTSDGCKKYNPPKYNKETILIGQNEIVTATVINRNIEYLWENLKTLFNYFDPNCI